MTTTKPQDALNQIKNAPALRPRNDIRTLVSDAKIKARFEELLGRKAAGFMSSILAVTNSNSMLKEADPNSIIGAAAVAAAMDLPIDPNLGFAYIVPYNKKGQFQIGTRGYIQLAQRSGQYQTINVTEVYENEIKSQNRFTGEIVFDTEGQSTGNVVGYVAYFRLINGFEKYLYMTTEQITAHGKKYSKSFEKSNGLWKTNFPAMAEKTVLRRLLSKYGILSIEMQTALKTDFGTVKGMPENTENPDIDYDDAFDTEGHVVEDEGAPEPEMPESNTPAEGQVDNSTEGWNNRGGASTDAQQTIVL